MLEKPVGAERDCGGWVYIDRNLLEEWCLKRSVVGDLESLRCSMYTIGGFLLSFERLGSLGV